MTPKERGIDFNEDELEIKEPSAWSLINFLVSKLSEEQQEELGEEDDLLNLVLAVKNESGDDVKNLRKIEIMAKNLNAIARLTEIVDPSLSTEDITKQWLASAFKKDQAKKMMN